MDTVNISVKAMEKMCQEAQRLWGPRPVDGVVWKVTSSDWAFLVADDDEDLHQFVYHLIDKAENATVVELSMGNGMIFNMFVVAKDIVSPLAALEPRIADQIEATEIEGRKKSRKIPKKQKSKRSADEQLEHSGDEQD